MKTIKLPQSGLPTIMSGGKKTPLSLKAIENANWQVHHGTDTLTGASVKSLHTAKFGDDTYAIKSGENGDIAFFNGAELRVALAGKFGRDLGLGSSKK